MAEVYGNQVGHWRVHVTCDVVQQNNDSALIRAHTFFQGVDGWDYRGLSADFGATVAGQTASSSTAGGISIAKNGQQEIAAKEVWVAKGHGNTNVGYGGYINVHGYAAGSSSANGTVTIGPKPSHTVSFNANGGSGAPGSFTKWWGEVPTIPNQRPTRTNYEFLGWSKSSTGGVDYHPGSRFGEDANVTLYAVWKMSWTAPAITSLRMWRSTPGGVQQNDGSSVTIEVKWSVDTTIDAANTGVTMKISGDKTSSDNLTGTSGTFTKTFADADVGETFSLTATITDKHLSTASSGKVGPAFFLMDINETGTALGIGRAAPATGVSVNGVYFDVDVKNLPTTDIPVGASAFVDSVRYVWSGAAWESDTITQRGSVGIIKNGIGGGAFWHTHLTFEKPFKTTPDVFVTSDEPVFIVAAQNVTATGFDYWIHNATSTPNGDTRRPKWVAVGSLV
jgi:uncharacterized repeat protein (TIGR02543 family)